MNAINPFCQQGNSSALLLGPQEQRRRCAHKTFIRSHIGDLSLRPMGGGELRKGRQYALTRFRWLVPAQAQKRCAPTGHRRLSHSHF